MIRDWVIILNYNAAEHCLRQLPVLHKETGIGVCLVDNHSQPADYDELRQTCLGLGGFVLEHAEAGGADALSAALTAGQRLLLLRAGDNLGYAGGNNLALRALARTLGTRAQYLIINPDVVITPETALALLHDSADICGPAIYEHYRRSVRSDGQRIDFTTGFDSTRDGPVNCLSGCCLKLSGQALADFGLLPESNFLYDEEPRYFERVYRAGKAPCYRADIRVEHLGSQTVGKHGFHYFYYIFRNRLRYYFDIAGPRYHRPWAFARSYAGWFLPTLTQALRRRNWPGVRGLLLGLWHGLRGIAGPYRG